MEWIVEIEKEIENLKDNKYGISVKKDIIRGGICADILIPQGILQKEITEEEIEFKLYIDTFALKLSPKLYCLTPYCFPNLADGRDLYKELKNYKNKNLKASIENLISDILDFIITNYDRGGLIFCGSYYLGAKYDLRILKKGCQNIINVKENISINGKKIKFNRVLVLSDIYFLLFEQEKWYKNNLTLLFWSSINNIEKIQKLKDNKSIIFHWTGKDKENAYLMNLTFIDRESFIQDLLEKMKTFGMNFDIMKVKKKNEVENNNFSSLNNLNHKDYDYKNDSQKINLIKLEEKKSSEKDNEEKEKEEKNNKVEDEKINNIIENQVDNKNKKDLIKNKNDLFEDDINVDINIGKDDKK